MALNPIAYTEKVVRSFLKYQLTAYPFADQRLHVQMRRLLNMDEIRHTPLLKGPYISLSRSFKEGTAVSGLANEKVLHAHMRQVIPPGITNVYGHQERAIRAIHAGTTTLVSTGTGSGKTECFLYPIISKCLDLRDAGAPAGICAGNVSCMIRNGPYSRDTGMTETGKFNVVICRCFPTRLKG